MKKNILKQYIIFQILFFISLFIINLAYPVKALNGLILIGIYLLFIPMPYLHFSRKYTITLQDYFLKKSTLGKIKFFLKEQNLEVYSPSINKIKYIFSFYKTGDNEFDRFRNEYRIFLIIYVCILILCLIFYLNI